MISTKAIKNRLEWADQMDEDETAERLAVLLGDELGIKISSDRVPNAVRRAVHRLRTDTWRAACMAFVGVDAVEGRERR